MASEPWLESDQTEGIAARREDLLKGLRQVQYWIDEALAQMPDEIMLWWEPATGIPSLGARLQHILGASRRLATYALAANPDAETLAAEAHLDWTPRGLSKTILAQRLRDFFTELIRQVEALPEEAMDERCRVGRKQLPVRRWTILHHLVEHAAYHSGQLILLVRLYERQVS
jgi:uncharacterized damage-inducible protein DinB